VIDCRKTWKNFVQHLYFFYFFITFSMGIISLGIAFAAYAKTRKGLIKYFLFFYSAFTLVVGTNLLLTYLRLNVEQVDPNLLQIIDYLEAFVAKYLLMFTTPVFIHFLIDTPHRGKKNAVFGVITLLAFSIHHYFEFVAESERVEFIGDLIDRTLFFSIIIYALLLGVQKYRTIQEKDGKSTAKKVLILIAVLLPGLLHDVYLNDYSHLRFFPLLYGGFSVIFILHFTQQYLHISAAGPPDESDFDKYGLSAREKEITLLILRGYSNQKIGKQLFISLNTVKSHVRHIFEKLDVTSRYELISLFKHRDTSQE